MSAHANDTPLRTLVQSRADAGGAPAQEQARLYGRAFQQAAGGPVTVEVCAVAPEA